MSHRDSAEIIIVDYGMGNLRSVEKAFLKIGRRARVSSEPEDVENAAAIVLPGVGAFGEAVQNLEKSGLKEAVLESIQKKRPFLGICLGLQLLFEQSEEDGAESAGLGIVKGLVKALPTSDVKVPHMGWNMGQVEKRSPLFAGIPSAAYYYFVHSYYGEPSDEGVSSLITRYGLDFASGLQWGSHVFAVQFHPEKSSRWGLKILDNFGELVDGSISGG